MKSPFKIIKAKGKQDAVDVFIFGDIGASWWDESAVEAAKFVKDLQTVDAETINVRINSYGGSVSDGIAIYNALRRHPATVNTHVEGVAISIASLIAMAGETMTMAENALLMIHGPAAMAAGNATTMREMADILDKYAQAMAPSYAQKTGKPGSEMLSLLTDGTDHWYTAAEAQAAGFADEVSAPIKIAAQFSLDRYRSVPAAASAFTRSNDMTPEELAAAKAKEAADKQAKAQADAEAKAAAEAAEAARIAAAKPTVVTNGRTKEQIAEIRAAFEPFMKREGIDAVYRGILEDPAVTVEAARAQLLTALGKDSTPANPAAHRVEMGVSERDKFIEAATESIMVRAGVASKEVVAKIGQNPYRGHKLLDLARASLERINFNTRGLGQMDIVASGFTQSTSDFPVVLENTMNKTLQAAYATAPDTWSRFCAVGSVSDFRAHNRYRLGSLGNMLSVNELGEFKNKAIPDAEKASIAAATKGFIINLSRQMVVNDDLGAFVGMSADMGRAARRTIEVDVYAVLAENSGAGPTMTDTGILFNSTVITTAGGHANRAAYAAPTVLLIDAARQAMASQKDVSQNDYLDLRPVIWLGPLSLGGTMRVINAAQYDPDTANKLNRPNMVANMFRDIVDTPRITWNGWYVFADPSIAPVIEVVFLDGNQQPEVRSEDGFDVDGARMRVRLDYGVGVIDYRGGYASVGS